jgi:Ca2+-binding RTX toxin-like protein/uncharacterized protein YukE
MIRMPDGDGGGAVTSDLWWLKADPAALEAAAGGWQTLATATRNAHGKLAGQAASMSEDDWSGIAADSYHDRLRRVGSYVSEAAEQMDAAGKTMDDAAWVLRSAQSHLDDMWDQVSSAVTLSSNGGFAPKDAAETLALEIAKDAALSVRAETSEQLNAYISGLDRVGRRLSDCYRFFTRLEARETAKPPPWQATDVPEGFEMVRVGNDAVLTVDGDVTITENASGFDVTGMALVGSQTVHLPAGTRLTVVVGGYGNIVDASATTSGVTIIGGSSDNDIDAGFIGDTITGGSGPDVILGLSGADRIKANGGNDRASGGSGYDYIDGGDGDDVLSGGSGNDTVYGLGGNDQITGGTGNDYLEGAQGDDTIDGDSGRDVISGGRGNDVVRGSGGSDTIYAGLGHDTVDSGAQESGRGDFVYAQTEDAVTTDGTRIDLDPTQHGSAITTALPADNAFTERVDADLDMLSASPTGQQMLAALDPVPPHLPGTQPRLLLPNDVGSYPDGHGTVNVSPLKVDGGYAGNQPPGSNVKHPDAAEFPYSKTYIEYNPEFLGKNSPPVVVLYHEMAHTYDYHHDTFADREASADTVYGHGDDPRAKNLEREAVGLPIDDDHNPQTPERLYPDHPAALTENALREEMNLPRRKTYTGLLP